MLANTGKVATIEAMSEFLIEHDVSGDQSELDHVFSASSEELPKRPEKTAHVGRQAVKRPSHRWATGTKGLIVWV